MLRPITNDDMYLIVIRHARSRALVFFVLIVEKRDDLPVEFPDFMKSKPKRHGLYGRIKITHSARPLRRQDCDKDSIDIEHR